ncbi:MAG TPA: inner membrane-spanning protein YciB [Terricaulis sp.]|nr:inner membrane-spanning protein YciB [Terricaulis sp.]HRP11223.1 inner membrane-spanning protein YciB [Terricaulis sp.]
MTESQPPRAQPGPNQLLIDLGPVALFVVSYNVLQRMEAYKEEAIYIATGLFMAATIAAIAYCKLKHGRIPPVLIVTGILVTVFGGLTIALHDETFIRIKPTFVYLFYAAAIFFSLFIKQNIWRLLFRHVFTLPDRIWNVLAIRWGLFFVFMAVVNEIIRNQYPDFWVNSRLVVVFPLILIFSFANVPLVLKHSQTDETEGKSDNPEAPAA